ncbi:MAG: choice-of-anchor Q domain-containing protein [Candidatus Electrothrix sp. GW3-4]|uniref:choice-of-anchor Q domain-containing protein n=1 Tax=Candidatus Electrothrix sp. GW3-4 TaxID=3126740 RepID=UPI0030D2B145
MKRHKKYLATLIGLLALAPIQGHAAEIVVDAAGNCTLADAIIAANTNQAQGWCGPGDDDAIATDIITLETDVVLDDPQLDEDARPPIISSIIIEGQGHTIDGNGGVGYVLKVSTGPYDDDPCIGGELTLNNATVTGGNHAHLPGNGGGLTNACWGTLTLNKVTVTGNDAYGNGGGIFSSPSSILTLNNVTVSGNSADGNGGGIYIEAMSIFGEMMLNNVTVSGNTAGGNGGGIYVGGLAFWDGGGVTVNSSIISGNEVTGVGNEVYIGSRFPDVTAAMAFNFFGDSGESESEAFYGSGFAPDGSNFNATSDGANIALSAILNPLADNGGLTMTHALVDGSPAIDWDVECFTGLTVDQRGQSRPEGAGCDAGSFEWVLNNLPVANAGEDQSVIQGETVCLDGSASSDPDNDPLSYSWELTAWPVGSTAEFDDPTAVAPCFLADLPGTYQVNLVVSDGIEESEPGPVEVLAIAPSEATIAILEETAMVVTSLDATVFDNQNKQKTLSKQIDNTIELVDEELYTEAASKLQHSILGKTDGCANSEASGASEITPDKNDWINDCLSQEEVYDRVQDAIAILQEEL